MRAQLVLVSVPCLPLKGVRSMSPGPDFRGADRERCVSYFTLRQLSKKCKVARNWRLQPDCILSDYVVIIEHWTFCLSVAPQLILRLDARSRSIVTLLLQR